LRLKKSKRWEKGEPAIFVRSLTHDANGSPLALVSLAGKEAKKGENHARGMTEVSARQAHGEKKEREGGAGS